MRDERLVRGDLLGRASAGDQALLLRLRSEDADFDEWCSAVETSLVDEYVQGELNGEERERFERIYLVNDERRRKVAFARAVFASVPAGGRPWPWGWIAAVTALALLAFGGWLFVVRQPGASPVFQAVPLTPGVERGAGEPVQVLRVPAMAVLVELPAGGRGRTAALFLSGETAPVATGPVRNGRFAIPASVLEETEYLLVISDGEPVRQFAFRVSRR